MKKKVIAIIVALVLLLAAVVTIISCVPTKDKTQENRTSLYFKEGKLAYEKSLNTAFP